MSSPGDLLADARRLPSATLVLLAALAGLLTGPHGPVAVAAAAVGVLALAGRRLVAPLLIVALVAAAGLAAARWEALDRSTLGPQLGHAATLRGPLTDAPRTTRSGWRAIVASGRERVLLRGHGGSPALPVGRIVVAHGALRPPGPRDGWLRPRHVHAILDVARLGDTRVGRLGVAGWLDGARERASAALTGRLPAPEGALLRGMVLGDDAGLGLADRDSLRRAGLGHLVAASGANVALLALLVAWVASLCRAGLRTRIVLVVLATALYVPLAGSGASIRRAGVMGVAACAATLAGRPVLRGHVLLLAAVVTLAADPWAVRDVGWQLSFAAVAAIAALSAPVTARLVQFGLPRAVSSAAGLTVAATIGTAPVSAAAFGTVSLAGLPANLLTAPLIGPVTWAGMLAALVAQALPQVGAALAALAGPPLALILATGRWFAALPAAQVRVGAALACAVASGAASLLWSARTRRLAIVAAPAVTLVVLAVTALLPSRRALDPPPAGTLRIAFLDVGQGDATLVQSGDHAMLVDSGPPGGPLLARLRRLGVTRLDVLAGTHAQADHLGGADAVLRSLDVGAVLDGRDGVRDRQGDELASAAARSGTPLVPAVAGERIRLGAASAEVLWPPRRGGGPVSGADPNDRAIVMLVRGGGVRLLLTADAESGVLGPLRAGPVDVLKVSHHGSSDPGLPALLGELRPRVGVIEVGRGNDYGHPTAQALAALGAARVTTLRTDRDGTVVVDARAGVLRVHRRV